MYSLFNNLAKFIFIFSFLTLSIFYFYQGYNSLYKYNSILKININKSILKKENKILKENEKSNNILDDKLTINNKELNAELNESVLIVKKNDTFSQLINPFIENNEEKQKIIKMINDKFDLRKLNIGHKIYIFTNKTQELIKILIPLNFKTDLKIEKISNNNFKSEIIEIPIYKELVSNDVIINYSIFRDGRDDNIPTSILNDLIRLYSFDLDFQRDIKKGNKLQVMYEVFYNENRRTVSYGNIIYTNIIFEKNDLEYFAFKTTEGYIDYFDREGKNVKKALMKTPIDGAKLSSTFGMRMHPILGYNKMHRGIDFAAPIGTPIFAAGNGVVEYIGRNGAYGKYIRIRHNNSYKTAYAHLNGYQKDISKGSKVKQGQIIGFVGSTGRSTGPHLHYEIIYQNKQINPLTLKLPSGKKLEGNELKEFKKIVKKRYSDFLFNLYE
ncbi:MAG: Murein DD-endopeptidase MepM [Alphaproteobacteria bacterium MarineAlpha5_Bin9]|nr:MAG: Murein DD-endopeptidase MepM [Alphaproteobacteria bacterium MarineAlpha5_Bin9]|tara:strand:+ start:6496 stop:7818 length:1323 start_codon:yes stop_codon:yes gene_type:complete